MEHHPHLRRLSNKVVEGAFPEHCLLWESTRNKILDNLNRNQPPHVT